jgi:hypothetical protein
LLWFNCGDPVSILTLAAAANDCYDALGAHAGKPSLVQTWLRSQSKGFQKRIREAQNFVKHGRKDLKGTLRYNPIIAEILMADSVACHEQLFGARTLLMDAYHVRLLLEHPTFVTAKRRPLLRRARKIYSVLDRQDFFYELMEYFGRRLSGRRRVRQARD